MSPRRRRGRRERGTLGIVILAMAGLGVWIGSGLVDEAGEFLPRALDRDRVEADGPPPIPEPGARIRVEVLNAGGVRGMAATARDELRDAGFDVVNYGNAASFDAEDSEVVLRSGDRAAAEGVAQALGIETIREDLDASLLVEVTVRLGSRWLSRTEREPEGA
jgi:hypothetical protein